MRAIPAAPPVAVRLGPGTFLTKGYHVNAPTSWYVRSGMKLLGSGMEVTVLQLAAAVLEENANPYVVVTSPGYWSPGYGHVDGFEARDFTETGLLDDAILDPTVFNIPPAPPRARTQIETVAHGLVSSPASTSK
jgi:hypothetical protein